MTNMMKKTVFLRLLVVAIALTTGVTVRAQHEGDHTYVNGICTIDGCTSPNEEPAQDADGYYLIDNAGKVKWIGQLVEASSNPWVPARLTADIDFTGVTLTPIGPSTGRKFYGLFDGQGHRIKNLVMDLNQDVVGLFGCVRGGSTIQNLIIDGSCSFKGNTRVGAFIGGVQVHGAGNVTIQNCVNEATVTATGANAGAFVGSRNPDNNDIPRIVISHCVNRGNITGARESAAFIGWTRFNSDNEKNSSGKHRIEYSYNTGTVTGIDGTKNLYRDSGSDTEVIASYDLGSHTSKGQGSSYEWTSADPVTSGELAFVINTEAGDNVFFQTIGTDDYPVPFSTSGIVYAHGNYRCDGVLLPGTVFDNTYSEGAVIPDHDYSNGICRNDGCTKPYQAPEVDSDGWTLLANAGNVEAFSNTIANGGGSIVAKVKLTADIDFENIENLHTPIGPTTGSKFKGEFDGQGHRIKNMIINQPEKEAQGFFGWLQGNANTTIRNLVIDRSCSVTGLTKCGGLAGASQNYNANATITIENVVNEANVTVSGQDAAGIVGGEFGNKANYYVHNVVNTGTITATDANPFAGALFCYQERGTVQNFINLGTINGHLGGNIGRFSGTWKNVVDLSETADKTQAVIDELTADDIVSGKLAYYMNANAEDEDDVFFQTLGTDDYPLPFTTSNVVYGTAWDGTNTVYYNNVEGVVTASGVTIADQCTAFALPANAVSATAQKVAYSRANVAGFNTVCLPFTLTADLLPAEAKIYMLGDIGESSIKVNVVTEVAAGVPCLVEFPADYSDDWAVSIDEVCALAVAPENAATLKGSYTSETIGEGKYKLNSTGTAFGQTTAAATIKPFRAYVETASTAKELTLNFGDETGINVLDESNNPSSFISHPSSIYDLQGRKTTLHKGINIVRMSDGSVKKVIIK